MVTSGNTWPTTPPVAAMQCPLLANFQPPTNLSFLAIRLPLSSLSSVTSLPCQPLTPNLVAPPLNVMFPGPRWWQPHSIHTSPPRPAINHFNPAEGPLPASDHWTLVAYKKNRKP